MRKSILTTGERADNLEQVKRVTKHVSECVRRANTALGEAGVVAGLFTPQAVAARARLTEACEKAITLSPGAQARRMEEILWRKVFYEPLTHAKKIRKGPAWSGAETFWVWGHLCGGVAYYHQLLHTLTAAHHAHPHLADLLPHPSLDEEEGSAVVVGEGGTESVHRCLTCLGDLTRYMLDLPSPPPYHLSVRYYLQALQYNREGGLTHSNLATVYTNSGHTLLATAHYLRALTCEKVFEGAEGNLRRLLDKSRAMHEAGQHDAPHTALLHTFLTLVATMISARPMEEVASLCQDVLVQLGKVLETYDDGDNDISDRTPTPSAAANGHDLSNGRDSPEAPTPPPPFSINTDSMVAICAVLVLCTQRLKKQGSCHTGMAEALLVSVLLTLLTHVSARLQQRVSLVDPTFLATLLPPDKKSVGDDKGKNGEGSKNGGGEKPEANGKCDDKKSKKARGNRLRNLRRRRRTNGEGPALTDEESGSEDSLSDENDVEQDFDEVSSAEEEEEEEEDLDMSHLCSSEDDDSDEDVKIEGEEWEGLSGPEHLELIGQEGMLAAVHVVCDWLKREDHVIQLCVKTAHSLWTAMARLLNLLRVDLDLLKNKVRGMRPVVIQTVQDSMTRNDSDEQLQGKKESIDGEKVKEKERDFGISLQEALSVTPLPEDLMLNTLIPSYRPASPKALNLKPSEMVLLRVCRLAMFGLELNQRRDAPLWHQRDTGVYSFSMDGVVLEDDTKNKEASQEVNRESSATPTEEDLLSVPAVSRDQRRLAGMQSLTAQWLQHEVRNLEERTARRATLGLYLVPDADVLIDHLAAIKMLLSKPTHMIIIPQTVIDLLDQQKRDSLGARDAIRWLEIKFRHGSRFIRAQRPHERTHLPLIKYPKRKDKDAWEWYQILECCHYLSAQVEQNSSVKVATVTLLAGHTPPPNASFSHTGLTHAAGAVLEHIDEFMRKWQTSTKGHS